MKKFVCILLAILLLCAGTAAFAADSVPGKVLDARRSVFRVYASYDDVISMGSGFAVGTGNEVEYIVTNYHVVEGQPLDVAVLFGSDTWIDAEVYAPLPDYDLCVLKLSEPLRDVEPFVLYDGSPEKMVGQKMYALGYPAVADEIFDMQGSVEGDVSITDGIISAYKTTSNVGTGVATVDAYQLNININHGNSGGPLVDDRGFVVGVNTFGAEGQNLNGAVAISELLPTLVQKDIPYKASSNPLYSGMLPVIVAVAAGAAAALYLLVIRKRIRKGARFKKTVALSDYLAQNAGRFSFDAMLRTLSPAIRQLYDMHSRAQLCLHVYPQNIRVHLDTMQAFLAPPKKKEGLLSGYSAPGQYRQPPEEGAFTDVYQLGAVMYRMLTGRTLPDVMARMEDDGAALSALDGLELTHSQKQALLLSVALRPEVRLADVPELVSILHIDALPEFYAPAAARTKKQRKPMTKKRKAKITTLCVLAGVVAVAAVGAGWMVSTYNKAVDFIARENYGQAAATLKAVPPLNDDIRNLKDFCDAGVLLKDGQYDAARDALAALGDYPDAAALLPRVDLEQGIALLKGGDAEGGEKLLDRYKASGISEDAQNDVDYLRGTAYAGLEEYETAIGIFQRLVDYPGARDMAAACAMNIAIESMDETDDPLRLYKKLKEYADYDEVADILDDLLPLVYDQGMDAFNSGNYPLARNCFSITRTLGEEHTALAIINASSYYDLKPYLDYQAAIDRIYDNSSYLTQYLQGYWTGGGRYFEMESNDSNSTHYDIPWVDGEDNHYELRGNLYVHGGADCFRFDIIDEDTMDVYAYANGRTYTMYRQ